LNITIPGLDDLAVRKAIGYAINREELITIGRLGYGTATTSAIPEVFYPALFDEAGVFTEDVDMANQILDDAGYLDNDADGTRNFPGTAPTDELEFDLLTLSWDDISVATGIGIETQMARINITINNMVTDDGPMYDAIYTGDYEMYTMAHGYSAIPDHLWWRCHSDNIYEWGDNVNGIDNATVDSIMDAYVAATPATLPAAAAVAAKAVLDNVPYVPLYLSDDTHALRAEWLNYTMPAGGPFTAFNPRTMVFMYDNDTISTTTGTTTGTDTDTGTGTGTPADYTLVIVAVGGIVGVIIIFIILKRR